MAEEDLPEIIWVGYINLSGLGTKHPIRCSLQTDLATGPEWWEPNGDVGVREYELGYKVDWGIIQFASPCKRDVSLWLDGAVAVMALMHDWSKTYGSDARTFLKKQGAKYVAPKSGK